MGKSGANLITITRTQPMSLCPRLGAKCTHSCRHRMPVALLQGRFIIPTLQVKKQLLIRLRNSLELYHRAGVGIHRAIIHECGPRGGCDSRAWGVGAHNKAWARMEATLRPPRSSPPGSLCSKPNGRDRRAPRYSFVVSLEGAHCTPPRAWASRPPSRFGHIHAESCSHLVLFFKWTYF